MGQSGSVTLEVAVLAPALLVLLGLVIAAGRLTVAGTALDDSASAAARAASLTRSATTATVAARAAAADALASQHLDCRHLDVTVDTSGFRVPVGTPAQIAVTVACTLDLSVAAVPGLPGQRTLTASSVSVLDTYRTRSLGFTP